MYRPEWIPSDILPLCDALHCQKTGASDRGDEYELEIKSLKWVLDNWKPSMTQDHFYAELAIKNLIIAILNEPSCCADDVRFCRHEKDVADYYENGRYVCYLCGNVGLWKG